MNNQTTIYLVGFAIIGCLWLVLTIWEVRTHHKRLRKFLGERGATKIEIYWNFGDRSNHDYNVEYTDRAGRRHQTSCKLGKATALNDGTMYWLEPPEV